MFVLEDLFDGEAEEEELYDDDGSVIASSAQTRSISDFFRGASAPEVPTEMEMRAMDDAIIDDGNGKDELDELEESEPDPALLTRQLEDDDFASMMANPDITLFLNDDIG